ncbi:hypothetical protein GCM10007160_04740 [Litchfieldella qijiaojingensis]|uniref:Nucleotidyltransferase family protein n=2 Tax=Litchfieldella qijiaojingensis TaxID=980347 RepID=A0ABQ2YEI8_9GAMM|nr:hypothetical protein GCM10007160_04740 [Halomonas qijiaojingensis]
MCLTVVRHNLHVAAAHRKLIDDLLKPLDVPHLFFKGHSLAARYYDDPAMRFCRDIDVLVSHDHIVELLEVAYAIGYTPHDPVELTMDRVSLDFVARAQPVITLRSPQGVLIEFHQRIDKTGSIYEPSELLANAETLILSDNNKVSVMPTAELFVYVCMHHTRHQWTRLHWLVDLDAIQRHPSFDWNAVYACASRRNLTATVEASQELYMALATPDFLSCQLSANGKEILGTCLNALQGDLDLGTELALRKKRAAPDFAFAWQASTAHLLRWRVQGWIKRWQPNYKDYHSWPLPLQWQWLYFFIRPFRELFKRLSSNSYSK